MFRYISILIGLTVCAPGARALTTEALLDTLQHTSFNYFWEQANPANGLIKDRSTPGSPCSIAAVGFGLSAICVGIDHGWVSRDTGRNRVLTTLQTFWTKPQGSGASGYIGYKGLYYHFLDMNTALRTWDCEVSTIDSALLFAGILDAKQYFTTNDPEDLQVRALADSIYYRADWNFFRNFNPGILMGWKPGTGFSGFGQWIGYNEAMILYILALGSPTHAVPNSSWSTWTSGYQWQTHYGYSFVVFPPLFGHQYSHVWIDFRYIRDAYMQSRGITYFENSRRATLACREYCITNPGHWVGYGPNLWGLTASDGPNGYGARGAPPPQNDNGTIAPTAAAGSVAFAPEVSIPALHNMYDTYHSQLWSTYGYRDAFNLTVNWWDTDFLGIDEGPIILMIENYRTGALWNRFMQNADVQLGLANAGFGLAADVGPGGQAEAEMRVLLDIAPNPFARSTAIQFRLPDPGRVTLTVSDVSGREVARLIDGSRGAGRHIVTLDGRGLPSGIYYFKLDYDGDVFRKPCALVK